MPTRNEGPDFGAAIGAGAPVKTASGKGSATSDTRRLTLDLDPEAHQAFRMKAAELDTTMKALLVTFVEALARGDESAETVAGGAKGMRRR
jgi:hypothetical protein